MKKVLIFMISVIILTIFISGCVQQESAAVVKIVNAKLESGSLILSLETNQSVEKVRVELVSEDGQVLCTKYKDLVQGLTEFEMRDCEVRKKVTVSVSPPGGTMITKDFQFELPSVRIKNTRFESGNMIATLDADEPMNNVRIDVIDDSDTILCSKYNDLVKGTSDIELTDCEIRERITVSVSPPKTEMITRDFTLTLPEVRIKNIKSELGKLILSLDANMDINNVKIHVFSKEGEVLCTATKNLAKGLSEHELSNCQVQNEVSVSIISPKGKTTTRDFILELPLLELKLGVKYKYVLTDPRPSKSGEEGYFDVYITKETDKEWEGIIGSKELNGGKKATLLRFKINKESLTLFPTYPLGKDDILREDAEYITMKELGEIPNTDGLMLPFILSMLKEMGQFDPNQFIKSGSGRFIGDEGPGSMKMSLSEPVMYDNWLAYEVTLNLKDEKEELEIKFFISAAKPYMLINLSDAPDTPNCILEKVENKAFKLSDYDGYEIEVKEIYQLDNFCQSSGVVGAEVKNIGKKSINTADITVVQVNPEGASISVRWDKVVIRPDGTAVFKDQCEGSGERNCGYQLTPPEGTTIHIGMHCDQ